jgi:hypothetical protein
MPAAGMRPDAAAGEAAITNSAKLQMLVFIIEKISLVDEDAQPRDRNDVA